MIKCLSRSLTYDCVSLTAFETRSQARDGIGNRINHYTERRPHASHGLMTPNEAHD